MAIWHLPLSHSRLRTLTASMPVRMAGEAVIVVGATITGALLLRTMAAVGVHPLQGQADSVLTAATAGAAAVVALLCALNARLRPDSGMRLISYAWGFYALVVMPVGVVAAAPEGGPLIRGAGAAAAAVFTLLFALGLAGTHTKRCSAPRAIAGGVALTGLVVAISAVLPRAVVDLVGSDLAKAVVLAGWGVLACICVTRGLRRGAPPWWRMGFGLALICAARALFMITGTAVQFATLRFIGFLVLLAAMGLCSRRLAIERRVTRAEAAERAAAEEQAAAERRHEIRNALFALSSVTTLMTPRPDVDAGMGGRSISTMVDDELARLRDLVEGTAPSRDANSAAVDGVLTRLVTLRRLSGARITLDCSPGIVAALPGATLAQVLTNLLANCARHAPNAEVYVGARPEGVECVIEVSDAGPGLDPASPTVGDGLGLALSARLVENAGGTLELRPTTRFASGATALLRLPLAAGSRRHLASVPTEALAS